MSTVPKSLRAPEGHVQLLAVLAEQLDAGAVIPCTGPGWADWTAEDGPAQARAADRCLDCPALAACAAYAVQADEPAGTWGAMTPKQRAARRSRIEQGDRAA